MYVHMYLLRVDITVRSLFQNPEHFFNCVRQLNMLTFNLHLSLSLFTAFILQIFRYMYIHIFVCVNVLSVCFFFGMPYFSSTRNFCRCDKLFVLIVARTVSHLGGTQWRWFPFRSSRNAFGDCWVFTTDCNVDVTWTKFNGVPLRIVILLSHGPILKAFHYGLQYCFHGVEI